MLAAWPDLLYGSRKCEGLYCCQTLSSIGAPEQNPDNRRPYVSRPFHLAVLSLIGFLVATPAFGSTQVNKADPARVSIGPGAAATVALFGSGLTGVSEFGVTWGGKSTTRVSSRWTKAPSDTSGQIVIVAGADAPAGPYVIFAITRLGNVKIPVDVSVVAPPPTDTSVPTAAITAPQTVPFGNALTLSGANSSDAGGQVVRWIWTKLEGPGGTVPLNQLVETTNASLVWPVSTASPLGLAEHRFRLVVVDGSGNQSAPAEVNIRVIDSVKPTAVLKAPNQSTPSAPIVLDGSSSSDSGGGKVTAWRWTRLEGSGGSMPINQEVVTQTSSYTVAASPAFAVGAHRFQLVVVDNSGNVSAPAVVQVFVIAPDTSAPTAVITAPQTVPFGNALTLSGANSSDAGGQVVRRIWTKLEGPGGTVPLNQLVETTNASLVWPVSTASPLGLGVHRFRLVVADGSGNQSAPAEVNIRVIDSVKPTAVLKAPNQSTPSAPIVLDGSSSSDSGGGKVTAWRWTRLEGSGGSMPINQEVVTQTSSYTVAASPAFAVGAHRFQLVVVDNSGNVSAPAVVQVFVIASDTTAPSAVITAPQTVPFRAY